MAFNPFQYRIIKRTEVEQVKLQLKVANSQITFFHSVIQLIEKKNFGLAEEQLKQKGNTYLTDALLRTVKEMKAHATNEDNRNWINEGRLIVSKILGQNQNDISYLADELIRAIVKHVSANQAALYLVKNEKPDQSFLEMVACYAYNRKKHISKEFGIEQGLIGQCFQEGETIYMTAVPADYVKITSGLGEALPRCIIIIPLKIKNKKVGILELAFFQPLSPSQREFLEAISEAIASTIAGVEEASHTAKLLRQAESANRAMAEQEEILRQNLEEITALQDDVQHQNKEMEKLMQELELKNREIEMMHINETKLMESKLSTQQIIHDKIADKLKKKIDMLQSEIQLKEKELINT